MHLVPTAARFAAVGAELLACVAAIVGVYVAAAALPKRWFHRPPDTAGAPA